MSIQERLTENQMDGWMDGWGFWMCGTDSFKDGTRRLACAYTSVWIWTAYSLGGVH
jgi:hypothetical protein